MVCDCKCYDVIMTCMYFYNLNLVITFDDDVYVCFEWLGLVVFGYALY